MADTTLYECRKRLQSLATDDGIYSIRCARTGKRPHPVAGKRFDSREAAAAALQVAQKYRQLLRSYDPQLDWHDLIVCEELSPAVDRAPTTASRSTDEALRRHRTGQERPTEQYHDEYEGESR